MDEFVEIIKAVAELLKPAWWPCAFFGSVWITRHELRALIKRISKLRIGHKDTTADIEIAPELATAGEALTAANKQAQTLTEAHVAHAKLQQLNAEIMIEDDPQNEQLRALRASTSNDLKSLEALALIAEKVPRAAIEESWQILKKNVVETAKFFHWQRDDDRDTDLRQAVNFLSINVFESQEFMIGVYALAAALQKVENNQDSDVSPKDAQGFVRYCTEFLTRLSFNVDKRVSDEGS